MNSVGIDISKGRSTIAAMRPFGEVVISPFEVRHTGSELSELARQLKSLNGETRVVMEATGNYHAAVVKSLHGAGLILFYLYWQIDMVTSVGVPVSMPSTSKSNLLCKREAEVSIVKARVKVCPGSNLTVENASQGRLLMVIGRLTRTACAYSPLFVTVKTIRLPPLALNSACV